MLKTVKWFALGLIVAGVGIGWCCFTRHIIKDDDGLHMIPRTECGFGDIYVDITTWGALDYLSDKPTVAAVKRYKTERMKAAAKEAFDDAHDKIKKGMDDAQKAIDEAMKKK